MSRYQPAGSLLASSLDPFSSLETARSLTRSVSGLVPGRLVAVCGGAGFSVSTRPTLGSGICMSSYDNDEVSYRAVGYGEGLLGIETYAEVTGPPQRHAPHHLLSFNAVGYIADFAIPPFDPRFCASDTAFDAATAEILP